MTVSESLIPERPQRITEMLVSTFRYLRANPLATLGIGALLSTVTSAVSAVVVNGFVLGRNTDSALGHLMAGETLTATQSAAITQEITNAAPLLALAAATSVLVQLAAMGVMTLGMVESLQGRKLVPSELWREVPWRRIVGVNLAIVGLMLGGAAIPVALAFWIGGAFGLIVLAGAGLAGVLIAVLTALAVPATVMDGMSVRESLRQSILVTRSGVFRTAWMLLVAAIVWSTLGSFIGTPLGDIASALAGGPSTAAGSALAGIVSSIVSGAVSLPAVSAMSVLIYLERVRQTRPRQTFPEQ